MAVNKLYNPDVLKRNLEKLNDNPTKQKVVIYISGVILNTEELSKPNKVEIEYINCLTDDVELYALANVKYKKICYLNQNTIIYMRPNDMKDTLNTHECLVVSLNSVRFW